MIFQQIISNKSIWVAAVAWFVAQVLKVILTFIEKRSIDLTRMYGSGGMPSSHSSLVTALTVSIGKINGFDSSIFAVSCILTMIVMYDAAGVRRAAGDQAKAINLLFNHSGVKIDEQLKELLGHTPLQVAAGAMLGIFIAVVI